ADRALDPPRKRGPAAARERRDRRTDHLHPRDVLRPAGAPYGVGPVEGGGRWRVRGPRQKGSKTPKQRSRRRRGHGVPRAPVHEEVGMLFSERSIWTMLHGIGFGGGAMLALIAVLAAVYLLGREATH